MGSKRVTGILHPLLTLAFSLAACQTRPAPTAAALLAATPPPALAQPDGPSVARSGLVLQTFFDAYNRHDGPGVLAALAETFAYGDCDFAGRRMHVFETRDDLAAWLELRFADGDQLAVEETIIAPAEGSPPNDPRLTAVWVLRTSGSLEAASLQKRSLFKIVLDLEGDHIQYLNTYGNVDCEAGR
jgi:hypothetical protein